VGSTPEDCCEERVVPLRSFALFSRDFQRCEQANNAADLAMQVGSTVCLASFIAVAESVVAIKCKVPSHGKTL
jgi:hypothetical protein